MLNKTYQPAEVEARLYPIWENSGAFACLRDAKATPYTIMMPPPNITGTLHMGHALTYILQDVLIRYRRAQGRDTLWQPGIDHAGIATQMVVERQLDAIGQTRHALGREAFIAKIWQWKQESGDIITRQLRRLGASPDWPRQRFTMDDGLSLAVRKVFVELHRKGLIYRDKRLVNWDPKLHTAISDLEVEQKEVKGSLWYIDYPIEGEPGRSITVATTRPETMLGDTGIAVHREDERWRGLIGKKAVLPLVGRLIPIVADEHCDPTKGSGAVKITPAHDFNDFEVGRRHRLESINIFDRDARTNDTVPEPYRYLDRFEARKRVLDDLAALGALNKTEPHTHMAPHGDRSGVVIEPWLTDQWYCDALTLAQPAIEAVAQGRIEFVPEQWQNTYFQWMRNIQPWCISRQLWWGHQIPAWYGPDGQAFVALDESQAHQQAERHYGERVGLTRDEDVLDTWFSSALWPFSTLGWPARTPELARYYPTDVLVTGFDIIFFWVARMIMMGLEFMGDVPFRTVYIHALVRDERGQKMSKSKGNVIDPQELIDEYGCDALRFTLAAMAAPGRDVKLAKARVEGYRNFATKLWNACRYAEMSGCSSVATYRPDQVRATVNRWIVGAVSELAAKLVMALDGYRFNDAANLLYHFVWGSFCDWYLEFTKPILTGGDAASIIETRATTAWAIENILRLLHPIMPFITEELWQSLGYGEQGALVSGRWPDLPATLTDADAAAEMEWVIGTVSQIRALRSEMNVPSQARLPLYCGEMSARTAGWIDGHRQALLHLARLSVIDARGITDPAGAVPLLQGDAVLLLGLAGAVDVQAETARLTRELAKLDKEIVRYDAKLANAGFLAKADAGVIEDNKERRAEATATRERLQAALARLARLS